MKKPGNTKLPSTDEELKALAAKEKGKYTYAVNDYFAKPKSSSFQLSPNGTFMSYREKDENLKKHVCVKNIKSGEVKRVIEEKTLITWVQTLISQINYKIISINLV